MKIKFKIESIVITEKHNKPIHADGTCTYIILTESPWIKSGGDKIRAKVKPTSRIKKKIELINFIKDWIKE